MHLLLCALVVFAATAASNNDCSSRRRTVVTIVGGGASGITAARMLQQSGIDDFVVLEAKSTVGGRLQTSEFGGYTIEDGANWIHGPHNNLAEQADNPLWTIKEQFQLQGAYSDYTNWKFSDNSGTSVPPETTRKWWKRIAASLEYCMKRSEESWKLQEANEQNHSRWFRENDADISMDQCLRESDYWGGIVHNENNHSSWCSPKNLVLEGQVAEVIEWLKVDFEYGEASSKVSTLHGFPLNGDYREDDWLVTDPRGYGVFIETWANQLPPHSVQLDKVVTGITSSNTSVTVKTADGTTIVSDYVLCTLPLGVLQKDVVQFTPHFSQQRKQAIHGMVMSNYAKLYLQFETRFWGNEETIITTGDPAQSNAFPLAFNLDLPKFLPGSKILSFHVADHNARLIESQPLETSVEAALAILRRNYGSDVVSPVIASYVTNWTANPLSYGSYSGWPLGYSHDQYQQMIAPHGRVHFGGEHTSEEFFGYLHGAYLSGVTQANIIKNLIFGNGQRQQQPRNLANCSTTCSKLC